MRFLRVEKLLPPLPPTQTHLTLAKAAAARRQDPLAATRNMLHIGGDVQRLSRQILRMKRGLAGHVLQHVRFHNTSGVGPHGLRVARKVHHADVPHPRFLQEPKQCAVLGAPMTWGQPRAGTDNGPEMIRSAGLSLELANLGWGVEDLGDIDIAPPSGADPQV